MTNSELPLLDKARRVYSSCDTKAQYSVAENWLRLAGKRARAQWIKNEIGRLEHRCWLNVVYSPIKITMPIGWNPND